MSRLHHRLITQIARLFPDGLFYLPTQDRVVALTIDDVPTPQERDDQSTRWILDAIATHNRTALHPVRATFFVISSHLNPGSSVFQDALLQGHEIANHGDTDTTAAFLNSPSFANHFREAHERITDLGQHLIRWYRPGRGLYHPQMVQHLRRTPGYTPQFALASMIPLDTFWPTQDPAFTVWYLTQSIFPGAILVLHGGSVQRARHTSQVLPGLLNLLVEQGYEVVTLSELYERSTQPGKPEPPRAKGGRAAKARI
jgi:peptidoglycan/xylan/chitin deacetylase (PgdA/CDA1 family)